jgi:hypothetical protein
VATLRLEPASPFDGETMKKFQTGIAVVAALAQAACASGPSSIDARYVSPNTYQAWSCPQLFDEKARVASELERTSGLQKENATTDAVLVGAGIIITPLLLIGLAATKDRKDEIGRLKGEYEALDTNIKAKQCSPGGPDAGASGTSVAAAQPIANFDGKYEGSGKTDSWCQTPSLSVNVAGNVVTGSLSEVSSGAPTGTVTGDVDRAGQVSINIKSAQPTQANGLFRGNISAGNTLNMNIKGKNSDSCLHRFVLERK